MNQPAQLHTRDGEPVLFKGATLAGVLQGSLFEATLEQRFKNPTEQHIEVVYIFPLPYGAVLLDLKVKLGDQLLTGCVIAKREAETKYEEALTEGDAAIMLERNTDGTHTLNLGNLAPHEDCVVTLRYAQTLSFEQRGLRLLIPTVLAPRYGNPITDGGLKPHQVTESSLDVEYPLQLTIDLLDTLAQARVSSPSHPISVSHDLQEGATRVRVTLAATACLDRDFILNVDQLPVNSLAVLSQDSVHPEQTAALISLCPRLHQDEDPAIAVKLLVDCSGSMGGDSIAAARRALQAIISQFQIGDRFSLSRFGSTVDHRTRGLWAVKPATQRSAQRWINDLDADMGGTEMEAALASTFAIGHDEPADVLLITDGEIYAIDPLLNRAARSGHRLFVVGIGSSPTEANLRQMAEVTGGACDFVAPGEQVEPAILRMFARLRSPHLDTLAIHWPEGGQPLWHSPLPKSVFDGDTVQLQATFHNPPQGDVILMGQRSRRAGPEYIGQAALSTAVSDADTVARLVASARLKTLRDREAADLAVDYELITSHTNFLLVHERNAEEKAQDMPELHAVKQMYPAGWGAAGSVMASSEPTLKLVQRCAGEIEYGEMTDIRMSLRNSSAMQKWTNDEPQEYLDIPAFLRRQRGPDPSVSEQLNEGLKARVSSAFEPRGDDAGPLTPQGLLTYLDSTPQSAWPQSYAELRDLGLPPELVDWLEDIFASEYPMPLAEPIAVEVFLAALMSPTIHSRRTKSDGPLKRLQKTIRKTFGQFGLSPTTPHFQPFDNLVAYMQAIEPDRWPEAMKAELFDVI
jgi:Ca-activated chloride channel family protein